MKRRSHFFLYSIVLFPVVLAFYFAARYSFGFLNIPSIQQGGQHWKAVLQDGSFWASLGFSAGVAIASVGMAVLLGAIFAFISYRGRSNEKLAFVWYSAMIFPPVVAAWLGFQWLGQSGWISRFLFQWGLIHGPADFPAWVLGNSPWALILIHGCLITPFFTLYFFDLYRSLQLNELLQMSQNFGMSVAQFFRYAGLQLLGRKILPLMVLYTILIMGSYEIPLVVGGVYPKMLSVYIVDKLQKFDLANIPQAYVVTVIYFLVAATIILIVTRWVRQFKMQRL